MKPKWVKKLSIDSQSPGALTQCYASGSHSARGRDSSNTSTSLEHAKIAFRSPVQSLDHEYTLFKVRPLLESKDPSLVFSLLFAIPGPSR